jgi:DNA-binding response OmpR family regulator
MIPTAGCDVLIVEDDRQVAEAIADGVRLIGYTVSGIAPTVAQALALTRLSRPRLAIIDVDLGTGRDGIELAEKMLAMAPLGVLFITGNPDKIAAVDIGHAWMPKPYRVLDLINGLEVVRRLSAGEPVTAPIPADLHLMPGSASGPSARSRGPSAIV